MRYLLLLYGEPVRPETLTPEQWQGVVEAHATFHRELTEAGALVDSSPVAPPAEARTLRTPVAHGAAAPPPAEARTLRTRSGEQLVVDGPFAETKEVLGGYYLIEAESLDAPVEWAKRRRHHGDGSAC